jgi:hypothetical protein
MQRNQTQQLIQVTRAVQAVIDASWIPEALRGKAVFFSTNVIWQFIPSWDAKQCPVCGEFALGIPYLSGSQIRRIFPYLTIENEDTINANVHPNCRCQLLREGTEEPKEVVSKREAKEAFIKRGKQNEP